MHETSSGPVSGSRAADPAALVERIRATSEQLRTEVHRRAQGQETSPDFHLFGRGMCSIVAAMERLEARTKRSVWNVQPRYVFDPEDPSPVLDARSRRRRLDMQMLVSSRAVARSPLLSSAEPTARVAPVFLQMLIVDEAAVVVEGPFAADGQPTAWIFSQPDLLDVALGLWRDCRALSEPVNPADRRPPLNRRQVEVARSLCRGEKDTAIARNLGVSLRTVERDIARVLTVVGATSRAEGVLNILGRGVNSREPQRPPAG